LKSEWQSEIIRLAQETSRYFDFHLPACSLPL